MVRVPPDVVEDVTSVDGVGQRFRAGLADGPVHSFVGSLDGLGEGSLITYGAVAGP